LADLELLMAEDGEVIGNPTMHRLELPVGDEVEAAYYAIEDGRIVFTHTEVPFVFSGRGNARDRQMPAYGHECARARGVHRHTAWVKRRTSVEVFRDSLKHIPK
jgi:predicted GNAT family acetyltransferase